MRKLFIDIETSPNIAYTWGLYNQNISIDQIAEPGRTICFAAKWADSKKIIFSSVHHDGEEAMVNLAHKLLSEADALVHYNGTKFDVPKLNNEFLKFGMTPPKPFQQIDLLKTARSQFKLASNKLDYVCRYLGIPTKIQHKGFSLWTECMAGDEKAWQMMKAYNKQDVAIMPELYEKLLPWIKSHPNVALFGDMERPACPKCNSTHMTRQGMKASGGLLYPQYQCQSCGSWLTDKRNGLTPEQRANLRKAV